MIRPARSLFVSIAVWIGVGLVAMQAASFFYLGHQRLLERAQTFALTAVDQALALADAPLTDIEQINRITGQDFQVTRTPTPVVLPEEQWPHTDEVLAALKAHLNARGFERTEEARFAFASYERRRATFHMLLPVKEEWLHVRVRADAARFGHDFASGAFLLFMLIVVGVTLLFATRRITRYLSALTERVDAIGRGSNYAPMDEDNGPIEVRRAASAFNAMQTRIADILRQRTEMLGAVSHDLRTIATRLTLRAEHIEDESQRLRAEADLQEMAVILDEALMFARDETSDEPFAVVDLASVLRTIADDHQDLGDDVCFEAAANPKVRGQPVALKRALGNLIANAVRYGGRAEIRLDDAANVRITDPGPGMSPTEAKRALEPFNRLEPSRNRESGGSGLGLAIAANVVRRHGGDITFEHGKRGFTALVRLQPA